MLKMKEKVTLATRNRGKKAAQLSSVGKEGLQKCAHVYINLLLALAFSLYILGKENEYVVEYLHEKSEEILHYTWKIDVWSDFL